MAGSTKRRGGNPRKALAIFVCLVVAAAAALGVVLYRPFTILCGKNSVYMLSLYRVSAESAALECSAAVAGAGGAGFVFNDGDLLVAAFCYLDKADAYSVKQRMEESYSAEVIELNFDRLKIKRWGDRSKEGELKSLLLYPFELMERLTDLIYQLDTFAATESGTLLSLQSVKADLTKKAENASALRDFTPEARQSAAFLSGAAQLLEQKTQLGEGQHRLSVRLKSYVCSLAADYHAVWKKL